MRVTRTHRFFRHCKVEKWVAVHQTQGKAIEVLTTLGKDGLLDLPTTTRSMQSWRARLPAASAAAGGSSSLSVVPEGGHPNPGVSDDKTLPRDGTWLTGESAPASPGRR
jgi:hypothetical protein